MTGKDKSNLMFVYDFKEKVPYEEYRHKVATIPYLLQDTGFCKRATFLKLISEDKKFMVGLEIHCFNISTIDPKEHALTMMRIEEALKKFGIEAEPNEKRCGYFPKDYSPVFRQ